ncbi:hypothetical protein QO004_005039 [Rhizobium mesoamericanum]|uniref:hypothetical protein n=1 Tax=Rhizobium mesoamericanum TaxID=1079800 RepID=UPI002780B73B|nr:hypothetical protein [Rhizobium mesoamericanum]MDQ0563230.1 hypothetical protein [Rhizobium mesoamericanum]
MLDTKRHDFSSLSVKDLLEAREAYHVHLAHLDQVYATAIGKYLIRHDDKNSHDSKHRTDPADLGPRTLDNCEVKDWSWPCVLVFVRHWFTPKEIQKRPSLAGELVPSFLYLPDGRVVPTCVIEVNPDAPLERSPTVPEFKSDLVGGGFPIQSNAQGRAHVGSIGCLVTDGDAVFALTNRHVAGPPGQEIFAGFKNTSRRLGISDPRQLGKVPFGEAYPGWSGYRVVSNLDAGLVRIDDVKGWTAQAYGIGEIGDVWDLNVDTFRLDLINCPLVAFGAMSGLMKGRILGLFYRYKSVGGTDYVTDLVVGPRDRDTPLNNYPGDSGTVWFEDDAKAPVNGNGARKLRPVALEWGGQVLLAPGARASTQLALGICLSTICRELDVELIPDWNIGHTEYWGEWGHVKIGAYATNLIQPEGSPLADLMQANADKIGLDDEILKDLPPHHNGAFSPLADVADLVWRFGRPSDESNHFADMDKPGRDGKTLLELCEDRANVDPKVWNDYYAGIGEDKKRGALPIRVWQIAEAMIDYARGGKALEFVTAAGIVAHYVGDACQPLHISQYHHGRDLSNAAHAKVHSVYETMMVAKHGEDLIAMIPAAGADDVAEIAPGRTPTGHDIAVAVVALMRRTVNRLPPLTIVDTFDEHMGSGQMGVMWDMLKDRTAACMQDGAKTLARVWEAAWRAAGSPNLGNQAFTEDQFSGLYMKKDFLPSYTLDQLTTDEHDHIVPTDGAVANGHVTQRPRVTGTTVHRRHAAVG